MTKPSYDAQTQASITRREKLKQLESTLPGVRSHPLLKQSSGSVGASEANQKTLQRISYDSSIINIVHERNNSGPRIKTHKGIFATNTNVTARNSIYGPSKTLQEVRNQQESA